MSGSDGGHLAAFSSRHRLKTDMPQSFCRLKSPEKLSFLSLLSRRCIFFAMIRHFPVAFENRLGHIAPVAARRTAHDPDTTPGSRLMSGCSSGVEHNLAKVGVERSNRFTRSISSLQEHDLVNTASAVFLAFVVQIVCRMARPTAGHPAAGFS